MMREGRRNVITTTFSPVIGSYLALPTYVDELSQVLYVETPYGTYKCLGRVVGRSFLVDLVRRLK